MAKIKDTDKRISQIGAKIKTLRKEKGYTSAEQFAYDHELPRVGYGNHEKGSNLNIASLLRIVDIHGISLEQFFKDIK